MSSFGWGRRQCLGMTLTQDELLLACGALAVCYNIKYKMDPKTGKEIRIDPDVSNSLLIIKPDYYELAFEPRSEKKREQIVELWNASDAQDKKERAEFLAEAQAKKAASA